MRRWTACGVLALVLAGCAGKPPAPPGEPVPEPVPRAEPRAETGNRSPYRVHGRTYEVLESSDGYVAQGVASWYGPNFHGRPTSSGEIFDMHRYTAAHRSLPLPTYAEVRNLENDRTVVVKINDRGPFKAGRIIDLSYAAALKLGMIEQGTTRVEVRALAPVDGSPTPKVLRTSGIYLQLGAFSSRDNALALMQRLRGEGIEPTQLVSHAPPEGTLIHRVRVGPMASVEEADELAARLVLIGLDKPRLVFD